MRDDLPSTTAVAVALARGAATLGGAPAPDPVAKELLPFGLGRALRGLTPLARRAPVGLAVRAVSAGLVDHLALRTAAIDDAVVDATARGVDQVVILGAGLDARAYRLQSLRDAIVFEVDHPATQRYKRARIEGLLPTAREVRFVTVDFTRDRLDARLEAEGHDADRPTVWIWEGVTMYLTDEATRGSLRAMHQRSAPGSGLAVTYGLAEDRFWLARLSRTVRGSFALLGEPLIGLTGAEAFGALLADEGWTVESDSGPADWSVRYRYGRPFLLSIAERLAVASCAP